MHNIFDSAVDTSGYTGQKVDPKWWHARIRAGKQYREKTAFELKWTMWHRFYRSDWMNQDAQHVNLFFQYMRTIVPRVYFRNPSVSIRPGKPGPQHMGLARVLEQITTKLMRQMGLKQQMKDMVQNTFLYGTGPGVLGYSSELEVQHLHNLGAPMAKQGRQAIEYDQGIKPGMPWFKSIHPRNFIVPNGTRTLDEARWTCVLMERPLLDVRADTRFSKARHNLGPSRAFTTRGESIANKDEATKTSLGPMEDMVELALIRDKKTGKAFVLAGEDTVLVEGHDFLQEEGFPNYALVFNPDPEFFWGVPDSQILEEIQMEINETRTQIRDHRRLALRKWFIQRGMVKNDEINKLLSEKAGSVIFTDGNPAQVAQPTQLADIPDALFNAIELAMRDGRETVGFSRNQMGEFNSRTAETTATEAQIVRMAADIRIDERRDATADVLTSIVKDMHSAIFRKWTQEQVVEVIGPGGVPLWVQFQPEMLRQGSFEVTTDPDNTVPETKQYREQRAFALYQQLAQNPLINPMMLTQYLLHEIHGTAMDDLIRALPAPEQVPEGPVGPEQYGNLLQESAGRFAAGNA